MSNLAATMIGWVFFGACAGLLVLTVLALEVPRRQRAHERRMRASGAISVGTQQPTRLWSSNE